MSFLAASPVYPRAAVQRSSCRQMVPWLTWCLVPLSMSIDLTSVLCRTWGRTSFRTQTRVQAGAVTKSPVSLTLFKSTGKTGCRYAHKSQPEILLVVSCDSSLALQVSQLVGKTAQQSEALYKQHSLYLNLASQLIQKEAFMGMVKGYQEHNSQASTPAAVFLLLRHSLHCTLSHPSGSSLPLPLACMLAESAAGC